MAGGEGPVYNKGAGGQDWLLRLAVAGLEFYLSMENAFRSDSWRLASFTDHVFVASAVGEAIGFCLGLLLFIWYKESDLAGLPLINASTSLFSSPEVADAFRSSSLSLLLTIPIFVYRVSMRVVATIDDPPIPQRLTEAEEESRHVLTGFIRILFGGFFGPHPSDPSITNIRRFILALAVQTLVNLIFALLALWRLTAFGFWIGLPALVCVSIFSYYEVVIKDIANENGFRNRGLSLVLSSICVVLTSPPTLEVVEGVLLIITAVKSDDSCGDSFSSTIVLTVLDFVMAAPVLLAGVGVAYAVQSYYQQDEGDRDEEDGTHNAENPSTSDQASKGDFRLQ